MDRLKRTQFWGRDENDDHLVLQIINGKKTATACLSQFYDVVENDFNDGSFKVSDVVEVYDLKKILRCIIKITDVYEATIGSAPDKLWQGECNESAEEFQQEHLECWKEFDASKSSKITVNEFTLVEVINAKKIVG